MPIVIQPTATGQKIMNKKMDKMGGGGMDIPMIKKIKKMPTKMEDMREYMDILDGIEEEQTNEAPSVQTKHDLIRQLFKTHFGQPDYNEETGFRTGRRRLKLIIGTDGDGSQVDTSDFEKAIGQAGLSGDVRVKASPDGNSVTVIYPDAFRQQSIEEDTLEEGGVKNMMIDVEDGMSKEEFIKKYPGGGDTYDEIKQEIMDRQNEDTTEEIVDEGAFKQAQIELQDWAAKYNKTEGTNGDKLADGYFQAMTNTGIMSDAYDADEVMAFNKMKGYPTDEIDQSWEDGDHEDFTTNKSGVSPITGGMFTEINQILSKYNLDVDDASDMYEEKTMENKEIEVEEDCGCADEAVEEMITMPVSELSDILRLAGYENYEEKIAEYANEPAEEYSSPEDQLIGLSGGLNRPKKSYPASAPGDNPMDQEPREVEETMEAVEEKLYKSYKDFLKEAEIAEELQQVKEYYVKTADDVMANLPAFAYRKSNPQIDTPEDKKYVAAIGDKADMVYSKLKKWLASGNNFNPNQIKMLDDVASKIEFLDPMDQTDEEVIDMLNSGLDTVMSIIEPKTERVEAVKERKHSMGRPKPAPQGNARPRMKPMGRPGMKSQMSNMPT